MLSHNIKVNFSINQKSLMLSHQALFRLAQDRDVGRLRALRALLDSKFNLLSFLQVAETVTLNGGEMDEDVRSTFAVNEAEAFITIEPLYGTSYTIRHCLPPVAILKLGGLLCSIGAAHKTAHRYNSELVL